MENDNSITVREAGRLGGKKRFAEIGPEGMSAMGKAGGAVTRDIYGHEHYAVIGRKGGQACSARHDTAHYAAMGKKGGSRVRELVAQGRALEGEP